MSDDHHLSLTRAFSKGLHLAVSRNGVLFVAGLFTLEVITHLLYVSVYLPLDRSATVVGESSRLPVGSELPVAESVGASVLTGAFTTLLTLPLTIIVLRTFVAGARNRVPEDALFHRLGRAVLSSIAAFVLIVGPLAAVVGTGYLGIELLSERAGGTVANLAVLAGVVVLVAWIFVGFFLIVVHVFFVGHEIAVRDRGVRAALGESLALVRGHRSRVLVLAILYVLIPELVRSDGFPAGAGTPGPKVLVSVLVGSLLYAVAWVALTAVIAMAYRQLSPDDLVWRGDEHASGSARTAQ